MVAYLCQSKIGNERIAVVTNHYLGLYNELVRRLKAKDDMPTSAVSKIYFFPALPSLARFSALSGLFWSFICTLSLKIGKKRAIFRKYGKEPKVVYFPLYELYSFLATLVCFQIMPTCTSVKTFKPPNSTLSY